MKSTGPCWRCRLCYAFFSLVFIGVLAIVLFSQRDKLFLLLPGMVGYLLFLRWLFKVISSQEMFLGRNYIVIQVCAVTAMLTLQLLLGNQLRFQPVFDLWAIYGGAVEWVKTGTFASQYQYMSYFPNNLGGMAFLYIFFKCASFLGIKDYYGVAMVLNACLVVATMAVCSQILQLLFGPCEGVFVWILFFTSLPFYFIAPVFYTDSLSMLFPVFGWLIYLQAQRVPRHWQKGLLYMALAGIIAMGMLIKFTVIIMAIALAIYHGVKNGFFSALLPIAGVGAGIAGILLSFQTLIYTNHLDRNIAFEYHTPYEHWIMMGLSGYDGGYNPEDYEFTRSISPKYRDSAVREELLRRIQSLGLKGMVQLWQHKTVTDFGNGTYALSDFLDDSPEQNTILHEYILYAGSRYQQYKSLTDMVLYSQYLLMVTGALRMIWKARNTQLKNLVPFMAVLGCWIFLMLWESSGRYFTNYLPVMLLCAAVGMKLGLAPHKMCSIKQFPNIKKETSLA